MKQFWSSTPNSLRRRFAPAAALALVAAAFTTPDVVAQQSVARQWNEKQLASIRLDLARPVVGARNLYHVSAAMWDAWATYDFNAHPVYFSESHATSDPNVEAWRNEAISFAAYRVLIDRYAASPGAAVVLPQYDALMATLGYDKNNTSVVGDSPAAIGNRIAARVIAEGLVDGANQQNNYANQWYVPSNPPLIPAFPGNPDLIYPNLWQPLAIQFFVDQNGNPIPGGYPGFLGPEWGNVTPFSLSTDDLTIHPKGGHDWKVYHDPGSPPLEGSAEDQYYKKTFETTLVWSSHLDPTDGVMVDASPAGVGQAVLPNGLSEYDQFYDFLEGGDNGTGYALNPITGQPYAPQIVPRGDYARCLAEFWADGPSSETPPGHWFTIFNYVADGLAEKKFGGVGPTVNNLEWDVKGYITLGGAMHDVAIACWGAKGYYDYIRPISAIRHMADKGQSSDVNAPHYDPNGLPLVPGKVEIITADRTGPGGDMEHLFGYEGEIAAYAWRGPDYIVNPATDVAGVDWILAKAWWSYQRPSFVTPPFAGYMSGHSTFSRAAANVMTALTGSEYFPNGLGEFICPQNQFLVFEDGPSVTVKLQWAKYVDASDQCSLSRIWGGIHPPADDIPGRKEGIEIAADALTKAYTVWTPWSDVGNSLAGQSGAPVLVGTGKLDPASPGDLTLSNARPSAAAALLVSLSSVPVPYKGGVLVANPAAFTLLGKTQVDGTSVVPFHWPVGVASGTQVWFQYAIRDAAAVQQVALSNAVRAVTP